MVGARVNCAPSSPVTLITKFCSKVESASPLTVTGDVIDEFEPGWLMKMLSGVGPGGLVAVGEGGRCFAIADEDLERETEEKTSSVHFLRFELDRDSREALRGGAGLRIGIDHDRYRHQVEVPRDVRDSLSEDLG